MPCDHDTLFYFMHSPFSSLSTGQKKRIIQSAILDANRDQRSLVENCEKRRVKKSI